MKLRDKVCVVTGGGQGIGRGIVRCLAEQGADVAIVDINDENANKVVDEVQSMGRRALAIEADVTDNDQVEKAVQDVLKFFGKIDILVNNVGGYPMEVLSHDAGMRISDRTEAEWNGSYDVNLKTHVLMCRAVVPHLIERKSGKIVNIASAGALMPSVELICYATLKAGVIYYTKTLARDLAKDNINVNCICPGVIYTPLWERGATELLRRFPDTQEMTPYEFFVKALVSRVPLAREQTPEDIGHAVTFLVSEEAKNITGQTLNIDGGMAFV